MLGEDAHAALVHTPRGAGSPASCGPLSEDAIAADQDELEVRLPFAS